VAIVFITPNHNNFWNGLFLVIIPSFMAHGNVPMVCCLQLQLILGMSCAMFIIIDETLDGSH
jgi:hypothetical protein